MTTRLPKPGVYPARSLVAALLIALLWAGLSNPVTARSSDAARIAETWGLLGTWSIDCTTPASSDNNHFTYRRAADGTILHDRKFGGNDDTLTILSATVTPDGQIELLLDMPKYGQQRIYAMGRGKDGRIRAMSNYKVGTAEYSVKGGQFLPDGRVTPWQTKCETQPVM
jgi:hypothetical protein